jgi:hypothetical protein
MTSERDLVQVCEPLFELLIQAFDKLSIFGLFGEAVKLARGQLNGVLSASVREVGGGGRVDWRSILYGKWRTTDASKDKRGGRAAFAGR